MKPGLTYIGQISTPYTQIAECPNNIQPGGPECQIALYDGFQEGLSGLEAGQPILILYWLDNTNRTIMQQGLCKKGQAKGTFALRSPHRPNPIGAAVLPIEQIEEGKITVKGLDCLNGTQLIDIKPAIYREQN